jgi:hypothetical protein
VIAITGIVSICDGHHRRRLDAAWLALPVRADWLKFNNPDAPAVRREAEEADEVIE